MGGLISENLTIIDVIEVLVWVVGVIYHERAPKTIAVLRGEMTMIPIGTCTTTVRTIDRHHSARWRLPD